MKEKLQKAENKLQMVRPLLIKYKQDFDEKMQVFAEKNWNKKTANMMDSVILQKRTEEIKV